MFKWCNTNTKNNRNEFEWSYCQIMAKQNSWIFTKTINRYLVCERAKFVPGGYDFLRFYYKCWYMKNGPNFSSVYPICIYEKLCFSYETVSNFCLPKGRLSEAAHEIQGCSSQKCSRGGVGWGGWCMSCRGGVCHAGMGWVTQGWDDTYRALSPSAHCTMW